jgi:hypothetical protein
MPNNTLRKYKVSPEQLIGFKLKLNTKEPKDYWNSKRKHKINYNMEEDN